MHMDLKHAEFILIGFIVNDNLFYTSVYFHKSGYIDYNGKILSQNLSP